ncbi:hypothetical protein [Flavobacterium sp.]|uniref:hypothetical protein n=1 Tax=Flavobacterium sp. TaxID=239 RepID=UPI0031E14E21
MRKISYPTGNALKIFEKNYLEALSSVDKVRIDFFLKKAPKYKGSFLTFDTLVLLPLAELISIEKSLTLIAKKENKPKWNTGSFLPSLPLGNDFLDLFDYKLKQKQISSVFRQEKALRLKTCHYCGIDYINGFSDFGDYKGPIDFLNNADKEDLLAFPEIGPATLIKIESHRKLKKIKTIDDIKPDADLKKLLTEFDFKNNYDHFTLDHVIPQKPYGFFSLCLYNLVPSCYCCNTKFKGNSKHFTVDNSLLRISPTSKDYSIPDNFKFKVLFSGRLKDIIKTTDFVLRLDYSGHFSEVSKYDKTFKLRGRYIAHKDELLRLMKKKVKYPDCDIVLKAKLLQISPEEYKKIIYGEDIFKKKCSAPMHKFKRDVAKNIKIM